METIYKKGSDSQKDSARSSLVNIMKHIEKSKKVYIQMGYQVPLDLERRLKSYQEILRKYPAKI